MKTMKIPLIEELDLRSDPIRMVFVWDWPSPPEVSKRKPLPSILVSNLSPDIYLRGLSSPSPPRGDA